MKKLVLLLAMLAPMMAYSAEVAESDFTKAKELSDNITAIVLGICAGLHLATTAEQISCINNGFDTALGALENAKIEAASTRNVK